MKVLLAQASLVVATSFVFTACGGDGATSTHDAAIAPADAVADLTLGADAPSCPALPCLEHANAVIAACAPSGACVKQVAATAGSSTMNLCFANGVTISLTGVASSSGGTETTMTIRKDGAACYSFDIEAQNASDGTAVYRDGAGVELVSESTSGATLSVMCPGEAAVVIADHSCDAALYALGGVYPVTNATACTSGTCTP